MLVKNDNLAEYLFHQGTNYRAYKYMGAHKIKNGLTVFRTWAPNADMVYLTGDFNSWGDDTPMERITEGGIWAVTVGDNIFKPESKYKYLIERNGVCKYKADPYAFFSETPTGAASVYYSLKGFKWTDEAYMKKRYNKSFILAADEILPEPVNIYEVHLGSWDRNEDGSYLTYKELASRLSDYVSDMGYTHIELMPVAEHPFDGSWGYQVCGYYAPTSRFGKPHDFMEFVNIFHEKGIGVILDWVPSHFPKDEHGLYEYDGGPLYEYQGADRMEHRTWGTRAFDLGRNEVQSFLISNALFWLDQYHIDGLRVDAVASMLYLDYDRQPGEWTPNPDGTNINKQAVAFFKKLNATVKSNYPDILMIAEESTSFPGVTYMDGLGFNLKWNMGWMNDTLSYIQTDPYFRSGSHNKMTFSIMYAFGENYVLPISHDEVVHGKKSLIDKMAGGYEQKFATMRTYLAFMMAHPGKKLLFMGSEFAQFREWNYEEALEWFMLDYDMHSRMKDYVRDLNFFYKENSELWERDRDWEAFKWTDADRSGENTYIFKRYNRRGEYMICVFNFSPVKREAYNVPVPGGVFYREIFNSDDIKYGGNGNINKKALRGLKNNGRDYTINISLPPMGACFFTENKRTNNH